MTTNVYVRLAEAETKPLIECERFTLYDGYETNEAGIAELRDSAGLNVEPDDRRWQN